jgi:hypothetical protein
MSRPRVADVTLGDRRDIMFLGFGDDVGQADDKLNTDNGLNDLTDTNPSWEDFVYGGGGRDVLIGVLALSKAAGANQTLAAVHGGCAARNGEPDGEIGEVETQDPQSNDNKGGSRDPQPGPVHGTPT